MAMNFWEAQQRAKTRTKIYLTFFITITVLMAILLEFALRYLIPLQYTTNFPMIGMTFLSVTLIVALWQYTMFNRYGGSYVAESVGGKRVLLTTNDPTEKMLLNIVDEMAIAASLPTPPLYIIDSKQINAFAAGLVPQKAAIALTRGVITKLNREEIQGVIAHEFGHIYNGDMKISLRLAAMVMGFFFVLYLALRMLRIATLSGSRRSRGQKGGNPLLLAAILLVAAGAITWLAGSILKASVSREREYLADASSVQFTRNPSAIANALKKIANDKTDDMPKEAMAFSHMFLDNRLGFNALFRTHPPLKKRIAAILGNIK